MRNLHEPPRDRVVESRSVRYATTSGQPATAASSVVVPLLHSAASAARSSVNDAERTTRKRAPRRIDRDVRRRARRRPRATGSRRCSSRAAPTNASRCRSISCARLPGNSASTRVVGADARARARASARSGSVARRDRAADGRRTSRRCLRRAAAFLERQDHRGLRHGARERRRAGPPATPTPAA